MHEGNRSRMRVGTDVEAIDDIRQAIERFQHRYVGRVFTAHEVESSGGLAHDPAPGLTARFAAKEAVIKVLRPTGVAPAWREIEIVKDDGGWCTISLSGRARQLADEQQLHSFEVSLSHAAGIGTATVLAAVG